MQKEEATITLDKLNSSLKSYITLSKIQQEAARKSVIKEVTNQKYTFKKKLVDAKADLKRLNLILGATGCGKSTLFNYLNGLPLKITEGKDKQGEKTGTIRLYVDQDNLSPDQVVAPIGHGFVSQTTIPNFCKPPNIEVTYVDCAGQFDNKDILQSIINAYYKHDLANQAQQIKLTIVVNYNDIYTNRGTCFRQILKQVGNFIGLWDKFSQNQSVSLVITSVPPENSKDIIGRLIATIQQIADQVKDLGQFREILRSVASRKAIAVFFLPSRKILNVQQYKNSECDPSIAIYYIPEGQAYKPNQSISSPTIINEMIAKTSFIRNQQELFKHNIQQNAQNIINAICEHLIEQIKEELQRVIQEQMGLKKYADVTQAKNDMKSKISCLNIIPKKEDQKKVGLEQIIEVFQLEPALLIHLQQLRRDLTQFLSLSNLLDVEGKIAAVIKDIILFLSTSISGLTEEQIKEANAKAAETQKQIERINQELKQAEEKQILNKAQAQAKIDQMKKQLEEAQKQKTREAGEKAAEYQAKIDKIQKELQQAQQKNDKNLQERGSLLQALIPPIIKVPLSILSKLKF